VFHVEHFSLKRDSSRVSQVHSLHRGAMFHVEHNSSLSRAQK